MNGVEYCDRCSQRATAVIGLPGGGELMFCGHHLLRNQAALPPGSTVTPVQDPAVEPAAIR